MQRAVIGPDLARLPRHVAIIMDGNGRWAKQRGSPRVEGHRAGIASVREAVETCARLELDALTLYAFSVENWKRPRFEIVTLMSLLKEYLNRELANLLKNDIRFRVVGRMNELDASVQKELAKGLAATSSCRGMTFNIALNYGGRTEIVDACRSLANDVASGRLTPEQIDEETLGSRLGTAGLPDPDLLIRTSGEMRVSNFLLWQIAYSEIWVTPTLWPDFRKRHLFEAILDFQKRERRYGGVIDEGRQGLNSRGSPATGRRSSARGTLPLDKAGVEEEARGGGRDSDRSGGPLLRAAGRLQPARGRDRSRRCGSSTGSPRKPGTRPKTVGMVAGLWRRRVAFRLVPGLSASSRSGLRGSLRRQASVCCRRFLAGLPRVAVLVSGVTPSALSGASATVFGVLAIALPATAMVSLRQFSPSAVVFLFGVVWICDSCAYYGGRRSGAASSPPVVSPNKTWEGTIGGLVGATASAPPREPGG